MDLIQIIFGLVIIINCIVLISVVFFEKRNTSVVLAWIMVFLFLPYVGFVLYLFFGSTSKMKVFSKKYKLNIIEQEYKQEVIKALKRDNAIQNSKLDYLVLNEDNPLNLLTLNNNVELLSRAGKSFERMFEDMKNAKQSIHIAYYIIKMNDDITKKMVKILLKKLNEGIEVRIIYDMYGNIWSTRKDYKELIAAGAEVYPYVPSRLKRFLTVNYHYHRKMLIIDGVIAHTGGINIGDEYYKDNKRGPMWRDTTIRITGSAVTSLQFRYLSDFSFLERQCKKETIINTNKINNLLPSPIEKGNMEVQIISSGPDSEYPYLKDSYYKMINQAKKSIYIQTPFFVPDTTLLEALRVSAQNGCDIKIMIPSFFPSKKYAYYTGLSFAEEVMQYGIRVYLYNGFIHSKTMVVDDFISTVGTTNFDIRSFRLDYEVNAFIYNKKFAKKMVETFNDDLLNSKELEYNLKQQKKWYNRFLESIFRLFAPLV